MTTLEALIYRRNLLMDRVTTAHESHLEAKRRVNEIARILARIRRELRDANHAIEDYDGPPW